MALDFLTRKTARRVAFSFAALALVTVAALWLVHTEPVRRYALNQLTARLADEGIGLRAKSLDIRLFALFASLTDVELFATGKDKLPPFAKAESISVRMLWSFGLNAPTISSIVIEKPKLNVRIDALGQSNLPVLKPSKPDAKPVSIGEVSLRNASVDFRDAQRMIALSIPDWSASIQDLDPGSYRVRLDAKNGGSVTYDGREVKLLAANADADYHPKSLVIREARIRAEKLNVRASGKLDDFSTGALHVETDGDTALLASFAGFEGRIRGGHSTKLDLTGPLATPDVKGRVTASDFWFDSYGPLDASADFSTSAKLSRANVSKLEARWGGAFVDGSGDVALNESAGESRIRATFGGLSSTQIAKAAKIAEPIVAGVASGSVDVRIPSLKNVDVATLAGSASVHVDPAPGAIPLAGDLKVNANKGLATISIASLKALASNAAGDVQIQNGKALAGTLQVSVPDANATLLGLRKAGLLRAALSDGAVRGALDAKLELSGTLADPHAVVTAESAQLFLASAAPGSLHIDASVARDAVDLRSLRYEAPHQFELHASGKLTGSALDFTGGLRHASVRELLVSTGSVEKSATLPSGPVGATFQIAGDTANPLVTAEVESSGLSMLKQAFGRIRASVAYAGDVVTVRNLQMNRAGGSIAASGSFDTKSQIIAATMAVRNYNIDTLQLADGTPVRMILDGSAKADGKADEAVSVFNLQAREIKVADTVAKAASLRGNLGGKQLTASLDIPDWNAKSTLRASLANAMPAEFTVSLDDSPIEAFYPGAAGRVTARANGTLQLSDALKTLKANAELSKAVVRVRRESAGPALPEFRVDQPATAVYDGKYVDLQPLSIVAGQDSRFTVSGHIPLDDADRTGLVKVQGDLDIDTLTRAFGVIGEGAIRGRLRTDAVLAGGGKDWDPTGRVELVNGDAAHPSLPAPVTAANALLTMRDKRIDVDNASASWLGGLIGLGGRLPIGMLLNKPGSGPFELNADFAKLDLSALSEAAGTPLGGTATMRLDLRGTGLDPSLWEGRLEASELRVRVAQAEFRQRTPLAVSLSHKLATLEPFTVTGPESTLRLAGSLSLEKPNPLALRLTGNIDAALLQLFSPDIRAEGDTKLNVAVTGTLDAPRFRGDLELLGVQGEIVSAQVVFEDLTGKIELEGQRIAIAKLEGQLNGGPMTAKGTVDLKGRVISAVNLQATAKGTAWNIPEGLETAADIDVKLTGNPTRYDLTGGVRILEGSYQQSLVIERGLFRNLSSGVTPAPDLISGSKPTPIYLDLKVETVDPIVVVNDLLNGEVTANLRVTGTVDQPGLVGRMDVNEGANFYLGGRNYLIDRGAITFTNQSKIQPTLDVLGHTRAGGVDINLQARGVVGEKLDTTFTSDPSLPQADIISLLVSGRRLRDMRGSETQIAQDQALSYLSGNLASTFSQRANRALGVNIPRIDPGLIADEAEPTARLTLGQDITDRLGLVYSMNLRNSSDQIWVGRYDLTKRFQTRVVRQSDNSFRMQFQHDIELGGVAPPKSTNKGRTATRLGEIVVDMPDGDPKEIEKLRGKLKLKSGKPFDFFALRKGVERIKSTLHGDGYPEAKIRTRREEKSGLLDLTVSVAKGSKVDFDFKGDGVSRSVRKDAEKAWAQSSFDSLRIRQASDVVKENMAKSGYFAAGVEALVTRTGRGQKLVTFTVDKGTKYDGVRIELPGSSLSAEAIAKVFPTRESRVDAALHPERVPARLDQFYRQLGYLDAKASSARLSKDEKSFKVAVAIAEGQRAVIGNVSQKGAQDLAKGIEQAIQLRAGDAYDPVMVEAAKTRVEQLLADSGMTGSDVKLEAARRGQAVDVALTVDEGTKRIVQEVAVEGNQYVSGDLVRSQIGLKPGDVLTDAKMNEARRNLYATGAFSLADLEITTGTDAATRLVARLREVRPFEIRYGVLYDTERGPGGIFDLTTRNILGSARTAGIRGRYDSRLRELRAYFEQPSLLKLPLKFVNTGFVRRELNSAFITDRAGGSSYLEYRWGKPYLLNFGYRFEQVHTFEKEVDPLFPFDIRLRIAPLTAGFSRDTRDDLLDATKGSFTSHIAEWAPSKLGSQLQYAKYFGQYFYYRPLGKPTLVPWAGGMKNRLVYGAGVRYGIAAGLQGQSLVPSERFFGGGSNSVRGFAQDMLGPLSGSMATGGESIFIANNELRFPLFKSIDGVGFADAGNVYASWRDFRFGDIRYTGGAGLRLRTPFFLFRLDYGLILDRRTGEPRGRLFFGIGQAF
jgi:outer membrane protein assembly complex protein YaeT